MSIFVYFLRKAHSIHKIFYFLHIHQHMRCHIRTHVHTYKFMQHAVCRRSVRLQPTTTTSSAKKYQNKNKIIIEKKEKTCKNVATDIRGHRTILYNRDENDFVITREQHQSQSEKETLVSEYTLHNVTSE